MLQSCFGRLEDPNGPFECIDYKCDQSYKYIGDSIESELSSFEPETGYYRLQLERYDTYLKHLIPYDTINIYTIGDTTYVDYADTIDISEVSFKILKGNLDSLVNVGYNKVVYFTHWREWRTWRNQ